MARSTTAALAFAALLAGSSVASAAELTLAWDSSPGASGYVVSYGTSSGTYSTSVDVGNQNRVELSGLTAGTTYYLVVKSYAGGLFSAPSPEISGVAVNKTNVFGVPDPANEGSPTGVATPTGTNVSVVPAYDVLVTFANVTTAGNTTVKVTANTLSSGTGFIYGPWVYQISTTAVFTGPVTVGIAYDTSLVPNNSDSTVQLLNGTTNVTVRIDPTNHGAFTSASRLPITLSLLNDMRSVQTLTVAAQGSGAVTSSDGIVQCSGGSPCSYTYATGRTVMLQPVPATGYVFGGWSSVACSTGSVTLDVARSCTAVFLQRAVATTKPGSLNFSGSGYGDVFTYNAATGTRTLNLSDGQGHFNQLRGTWSANWQVYPADFNGDGLTDLFLYNRATGQWYKATNNGAGDFTYFLGQWSAGWQVSIVDLDGDGKSDVFLYSPASGDWYRCTSTGAGTGDFSYVLGHWSAGWQVYPADFNADGKTDLFLYHPVIGVWYQAVNDGANGFTYTNGTWSAGWSVTLGDFNGDGRTDVFLYQPLSGAWTLATTQSAGNFAYVAGAWSAGWTLRTGDFNGDGKTDLFLYNPAIGWWYEATSSGSGSFAYSFGTWSANWQVQVSDLNSDGKSDVVVYNPTLGVWYQAINTGLGSFAYGSGVWDTGLTVFASR